MSLNRSLLFALIFALQICAEEVNCPAYKDKHPLANVVVFDGPPEQKADLMPDVSRGRGNHAYASWDVGYIFQAGRSPYLVCKYSGGDSAAVTVKIERKVRRCVYRSHGIGAPVELRCK